MIRTGTGILIFGVACILILGVACIAMLLVAGCVRMAIGTARLVRRTACCRSILAARNRVDCISLWYV